jgi:hypothetical protein
MKRQIGILFFSMMFGLGVVAGAGLLQGTGGWPVQWETLGRKVSAQQNQSGIYRDHSVYRQNLSLIRLDVQKDSMPDDSWSTRRYQLTTGPNARGEIAAQTDSAVDGAGRKLTDEWSTPGILTSARFWEELFFPFFPEKIKRYDIWEVENSPEGEVRAMSIHFLTRPGLKGVPIMEGYAYVTPKGEMLRLVWKEVRQLETLDPVLAGWTISNVSVIFSAVEDGVQLPQTANLEFTAKSKQWKGSYRLRYQESGHQAGTLTPKP